MELKECCSNQLCDKLPSWRSLLFMDFLATRDMIAREAFIAKNSAHIKSFSVGMILYAFSFLGFASTGNLVLLAGNTAMLTVGECLCNPFLSVTISRISPANKRGEYFGFSSSIIGTIFPLGPLVGTIFLTYLFNPQILMWALFFAINASLAIISLVARKSIKSRERQLGNLSHS